MRKSCANGETYSIVDTVTSVLSLKQNKQYSSNHRNKVQRKIHDISDDSSWSVFLSEVSIDSSITLKEL